MGFETINLFLLVGHHLHWSIKSQFTQALAEGAFLRFRKGDNLSLGTFIMLLYRDVSYTATSGTDDSFLQVSVNIY